MFVHLTLDIIIRQINQLPYLTKFTIILLDENWNLVYTLEIVACSLGNGENGEKCENSFKTLHCQEAVLVKHHNYWAI